MHTAEITKEYEFQAAHHLPYHDGHCRNVHGHSYRLAVSVTGPVQGDWAGGGEDIGSQRGMVMDFAHLTQLVKEQILTPLDHTDLNTSTPVYPTAENLAHWMWHRLAQRLPPLVFLSQLQLWETRTGSITLRPGDIS